MSMSFRTSMKKNLLAVLAITALFASAAGAQPAYPSRPIHLVVGFPPGGANDILARLVGAKLQEQWGQPVPIDNKPGANAIIATEFVARAAPDGYTLLVGASGAMTFNPGLYAKLPYDPLRDFEPVTMLGSFPLVLAVNPMLPAQSVKELVQLAARAPRSRADQGGQAARTRGDVEDARAGAAGIAHHDRSGHRRFRGGAVDEPVCARGHAARAGGAPATAGRGNPAPARCARANGRARRRTGGKHAGGTRRGAARG